MKFERMKLEILELALKSSTEVGMWPLQLEILNEIGEFSLQLEISIEAFQLHVLPIVFSN